MDKMLRKILKDINKNKKETIIVDGTTRRGMSESAIKIDFDDMENLKKKLIQIRDKR